MRTKTIERKRYSLRCKKENEVPTLNHSFGVSISVKETKANFQSCLEERRTSTVQTKNTISNSPKGRKEILVPVALETNNFSEKPNQSPIKKLATSGSIKRKAMKPSKTLPKEDCHNAPCEGKNEKLSKNDCQVISNINVSTTADHADQTNLDCNLNLKKPEDDASQHVHSALEHAINCSVSPEECQFPKCLIAKQFLIHCSTCSKKSDDCTICTAMGIMVCKHAQVCDVPLERCCQIPNCDKVRLMVLEEWVRIKHKHNEMMQRVFRGLMHAKKCRDKNCDLLLCRNVKKIIYHTHKCKQDEDCKTKKFIVQLCQHHQQICMNENCDVEFCQENAKLRKLEEKSTENLLNNPTNGIGTPDVLRNSMEYFPNFVPWEVSFGSMQQQQQQQMYPLFNPLIPSSMYENEMAAISVQDSQPPLHELPNSQELLSKESGQSINRNSPTDDMYYQLWQNKDEFNRNHLPRLSPNDLQTILMSRSDDIHQLLSPVTDNRAKYSEVATFPSQDSSSRSSQESELEENPLPLTQFDNILKPLSNNQVHAQSEDLSNKYEKSNSSVTSKNQNEWSKTDFMKQHLMQQGVVAETETADESDSDGLSYHDSASKLSIQQRDKQKNEHVTNLEATYLSGLKYTTLF